MRTGQTKSGPSYSPDDGDQTGFLVLMQKALADKPVNQKDIEDFVGRYCFTGGLVGLRTERKWVKEFHSWLGQKQYGGAI